MKTPREILLGRHQAAQARLDRIRQDAVAEMTRDRRISDEPAPARELPLLAAAALKLWRELILPSRTVWTGLVAVWLMILGFHLGSATSPGVTASTTAVPAQELRTALERRREMFTELAQLPQAETASKPDRQPRSERRATSACA